MNDELQLNIAIAKACGWQAQEDVDRWWINDETGKGVDWGGTEEMAWQNAVEPWASDSDLMYYLAFTGSLHGRDWDTSKGFGRFLCEQLDISAEQIATLWLLWKQGKAE